MVLNRSHNSAHLSIKDVAGALGLDQRAIVELPESGPTCTGRVNRGTPFIVAEPNATLSRSLEQLALSLGVRA